MLGHLDTSANISNFNGICKKNNVRIKIDFFLGSINIIGIKQKYSWRGKGRKEGGREGRKEGG